MGDFWLAGRLALSMAIVSRKSGGGEGCGGGGRASVSFNSIASSGSGSGSGSSSGSGSGSIFPWSRSSCFIDSPFLGGRFDSETVDGEGAGCSRHSSSSTSASFFCGGDSGVIGEQRSMVRDLSSVSLELATMPLSLLLPQSSESGFSAGGDLLSIAREEATADGIAFGTIVGGAGAKAGARAVSCDNDRFGFEISLRGAVDVALVATDADKTSFGTGADGATSFGG